MHTPHDLVVLSTRLKAAPEARGSLQLVLMLLLAVDGCLKPGLPGRPQSCILHEGQRCRGP